MRRIVLIGGRPVVPAGEGAEPGVRCAAARRAVVGGGKSVVMVGESAESVGALDGGPEGFGVLPWATL